MSEIDLIRDKSSVIVVQPFTEKGSLKDLIYKVVSGMCVHVTVTAVYVCVCAVHVWVCGLWRGVMYLILSCAQSEPTADWSVKYSVRRKGLPMETVALYGRQILEVKLSFDIIQGT